MYSALTFARRRSYFARDSISLKPTHILERHGIACLTGRDARSHSGRTPGQLILKWSHYPEKLCDYLQKVGLPNTDEHGQRWNVDDGWRHQCFLHPEKAEEFRYMHTKHENCSPANLARLNPRDWESISGRTPSRPRLPRTGLSWI